MTQIASLCRSFSLLVIEEPIRAIEQPINLARHDEVVLMQSFDRLGAQRDSSITPAEADVGVMAFCLCKLTNFLNKAPRFPEIVESNGPLDAVGRPPLAIDSLLVHPEARLPPHETTGAGIAAMDEVGSWDNLNERFEVKRINHQEAYSMDDACANWAEEFFSRMRRAEIVIHHHIAGADLLRYAQKSSWRDDNRRLRTVSESTTSPLCL
jgi:hypothetical protein